MDISDDFDITAKFPNFKKFKLKIFNRKNKEKLLLDFLYWREKDIHPADANNLVNKFLNRNNDDE